ncbi:hypothetical protein DFJ74DRAFT_422527 [Hyaloraphidium curvatum]|nr:hypothetical protein DFJ74DRAFT_422527 [Hyaloraphidium curvatum]
MQTWRGATLRRRAAAGSRAPRYPAPSHLPPRSPLHDLGRRLEPGRRLGPHDSLGALAEGGRGQPRAHRGPELRDRDLGRRRGDHRERYDRDGDADDGLGLCDEAGGPGQREGGDRGRRRGDQGRRPGQRERRDRDADEGLGDEGRRPAMKRSVVMTVAGIETYRGDGRPLLHESRCARDRGCGGGQRDRRHQGRRVRNRADHGGRAGRRGAGGGARDRRSRGKDDAPGDERRHHIGSVPS